jgi:predicted HAD superfamily Cof-like phosphohydrolase
MTIRYTHTYRDALGHKYYLIFQYRASLPGFAIYEAETGSLLQIHDHQVTPVAAPDMLKSNPNLIQDIEEFHAKFGLQYSGPPRTLETQLELFRMKFFEEEYNELVGAETDEDKLDACVDLVYIILGYCHLRGWNFAEAWRRIQAANMQKVRARSNDMSKRGSSYDVVKPKGWVAPSLKDLV